MLDYEICYYKIDYLLKNPISWYTEIVYTEEEAVNFIKENRDNWAEYELFKIQSAVIDF